MKSVKDLIQLAVKCPCRANYNIERSPINRKVMHTLTFRDIDKTTTIEGVHMFCGGRLTELKQRKLTLLKSTIQNL